MIGRLNHVAIATKDLEKAAAVYRDMLGAKVSEPVPQPDHGVTTVFVELPGTKIELLAPLGENSPIANFLARNPERRRASSLLRGGRHPCRARPADGARRATGRLGAEPKIGAHGKPVMFLHPKDFVGTLIELEQA